MDNEERGDGLGHDPSEPAEVDAADQAAPADSADAVETVADLGTPADVEPVTIEGAAPVVEDPIAVVEDPLPVVEDPVPVVEPEPTEPVAVFEPEAEADPAPVDAYDSYDSYEAASYADEPTVAHEVFAPPTPAAATFATPAAVEEIEVEADDDEEDEERKGISFATKAIVVGAAWVLLVLFLIGQFESDDDPGLGPVGLDQTEESADGTELAAGEEGGEEPVDLDGDGEIEPGEPGFGSSGSVEGASTAGGTSGGSGSGGTSGGGSGSTSGGGGTGDGTSDDAPPVTLPGGAPAPTSTTTTVKGGSTSTTATTAKPGGGGGGSTSTTAPTTTTAPGDSTPVVTATGDCQFSPPTVSISRNAKVRFTNNTGSSIKVRFSSSDKPSVANGASYDRTFTSNGIYNVGCEQSGVKSTVTITVT